MKLLLSIVAVVLSCLGWYIFGPGDVYVTTASATVSLVPPSPSAKPTAPPPPSAVAAAVPATPAVAAAPPAAARPAGAPQIVLADVLGPNNLYHDDLLGISMTYPEGWRVRDAKRWGTNNHENTLWLLPDGETTASPSMYYKNYTDTPPDSSVAEAYLRKQAQEKEDFRISGGIADYKNVPESFAFTDVNGNPSLSYFATFTRGDQVMTEYFVRVLGQQGYVMFFTTGKLEDVKAIMPQVNQMAASVKVP